MNRRNDAIHLDQLFKQEAFIRDTHCDRCDYLGYPAPVHQGRGRFSSARRPYLARNLLFVSRTMDPDE